MEEMTLQSGQHMWFINGPAGTSCSFFTGTSSQQRCFNLNYDESRCALVSQYCYIWLGLHALDPGTSCSHWLEICNPTEAVLIQRHALLTWKAPEKMCLVRREIMWESKRGVAIHAHYSRTTLKWPGGSRITAFSVVNNVTWALW